MGNRLKDIYDQVISFENLYIAEKEVGQNARGGKKNKACLKYRLNLEDNLHKLHQRLSVMDFPKVDYHSFLVYEPKTRLVVCTDYETKVVQRAIYDVLNPVFSKKFIADTYSCIEGRGQYAAIKRLKSWFEVQNRSDIEWAYGKFDIMKFFYRIDHEILMDLLAQKIGDKKLLKLCRHYIDETGAPFGIPYGADPMTMSESDMLWDCGIPIGGGLSHLFGNIMLDALDQFAKRVLGIKRYIRYMDDVVIVEPGINTVRDHGTAMEQYINEKLNLRLNNKTAYRPVRCGCEFVGVRIYPDHFILRKSTTLRMKRHLDDIAKQYHDHKITFEQARSTVVSYKAMLNHVNNKRLDRAIWSRFVLTHGDLKDVPYYDSAMYTSIVESIRRGDYDA